MSSAPQNFYCDSCSQTILPTNPRIHCLHCNNYDLCANCAIAERFTNGHIAQHTTQVLKESGGSSHYPVPSASTIVYGAAAQSFTMPTPGSAVSHAGPPPLPPHQTAAPAPSAGPGWQPFFLPDSTPTATYTTLMNDIFSYQDPQNTGVLVPEVFSRVLDDMGYQTHENTWKSALTATYNQSAESNADMALKGAFDLFSIDHQLLQRAGNGQQPQALGGFMRGAFIGSTQASPPMPAITRKGFIDISIVQALSDPSREWGNLSRLLRKYNLPRYVRWGDLPRTVLPAMPDQAVLNRVAGIMSAVNQQGEQSLEAARMRAQISARAHQIAGDILGDTRHEYRYF